MFLDLINDILNNDYTKQTIYRKKPKNDFEEHETQKQTQQLTQEEKDKRIERVKDLMKKMKENTTYIKRLEHEIDIIENMLDLTSERLSDEAKEELQNIIDDDNKSIDAIIISQRYYSKELTRLQQTY